MNPEIATLREIINRGHGIAMTDDDLREVAPMVRALTESLNLIAGLQIDPFMRPVDTNEGGR